MALDFCDCGCKDAEAPPDCPECSGPILTSWSPSIEGTGYGHRGFVCDSVSCGWWDG